MKCENCPFLRTEGYEYPESYGIISVPERKARSTFENDTDKQQ